MTGADLAARLAMSGLDSAEIPGKTALYGSALAAFSRFASGPPARAWWIPGRLEVFGRHTDYAGGRTLVAPLPRGFACLGSLRSGDEVRIVDARSDERVALGREPPRFPDWRRYVEIAVFRLARNFPGARRGVDIAFASDLPRASGVSSSSALMVGVATALADLWRLHERVEWKQNIRDDADLATYYACLENGTTFGTLGGDEGVGTHGGSEDHAAMLLGKPGCVSAFAFAPIRHLDDALIPETWRLVVASSGLAAEKTGAARALYNRLAEGTDILRTLWNQAEPPQGSLAAALASSPTAITRLRTLIQSRPVSGWQAGALANRLSHFDAEDARILDAVQAFREGDAGRLGILSAASQQDAERLLGNQTPETAALAAEARAAGAFAACSFGAGFGGSVWALAGADEAGDFAERWLTRYRARYPSLAAAAFIATPGPGVIRLAGA